MKTLGIAAFCGLMLVLMAPSPAIAQDDAAVVSFGIYYRCNQGQEARADEIFAASVAPVTQRHVDSGNLTASLWLTHVQGGAWRRLFVMLGDDLPSMMDVREAVVNELNADAADAMAELNSICSSHDDYIWIGVANSPVNPDQIAAGPASLAAYRTCDIPREARADEIFTELLAPLYQKHMDLGHLAGWGFLAHRAGGQFRRLETMSGADHKTLLEMQNAIYTEAGEIDEAAMQEFMDICGPHTDYMWENRGGS